MGDVLKHGRNCVSNGVGINLTPVLWIATKIKDFFAMTDGEGSLGGLPRRLKIVSQRQKRSVCWGGIALALSKVCDDVRIKGAIIEEKRNPAVIEI